MAAKSSTKRNVRPSTKTPKKRPTAKLKLIEGRLGAGTPGQRSKTSKKKIPPLSKTALLAAYTDMYRVRKLNEKSIILYKQNKAHFQISSDGHEAVGVAAAQLMEVGVDWAYPYYRELPLVATLGMTNRELLLSFMNKAADPCSGGRTMPMHYGHKDLNIVSHASPTGTQFLQAVGTAHALKYQKRKGVVYTSSGEGTTAQGEYYEALNWAAREKLPVVFCIQDNGFAISVPKSDQVAGGDLGSIARGFKGVNVIEVNGLDFVATKKAFIAAYERARSGKGPSVIITAVVRLHSHSISDNQAKYRTDKEIKRELALDPIPTFEKFLIRKKFATKKQIRLIQDAVIAEINADTEWAEVQPDPDPSTVEDHIFKLPDPALSCAEAVRPMVTDESQSLFMVDAINQALDEELAHDDRVLMFGEDIAYGKGGVFTVTAGLTSKHTDKRVFNSPLAEASILGTAFGMAVAGLKPVVEIQFADFIWPAMNQIRNEVSHLHYRTNGAFTCPMVIRAPVGGYINGGLYHSQNIEATFAHFPGLQVVLPSNAWDAKGMLKAAIRGTNPVMFLEHKGLYRQVFAKGPKSGVNDLIPLGKANVVRQGSDMTIVTYGAIVQRSLQAAENLERMAGVSVEVIDLRSIYPLDVTTILNSVKKTNRLLIAHEDVLFMGFGAEIAAIVAEQAFEYLDAPIMRVGGKFTPIPHAPMLEKAVLPNADWVEAAAEKLLGY